MNLLHTAGFHTVLELQKDFDRVQLFEPFGLCQILGGLPKLPGILGRSCTVSHELFADAVQFESNQILLRVVERLRVRRYWWIGLGISVPRRQQP